MLSTKQRLIILLLLLIIGLIPVSAIVLARVLNLGTNVHDPLYFDSVKISTFEYNNGTHVIPLTFNSVLNGTSYQAEVSYGGNDFMFNITPDGRFVDNLRETNNYSIFWVHIVVTGSGGSETTEQVGRNFSIWDNFGILGAPNTEYVLTVTAQSTYWSEEAGLHGAQFSLLFVVRDLSNRLIANGEFDYTCGMLFFLSIGDGNGLSTLKLLDTTYDISRNRLTGIPWVIGVIIGAPCIVFAFLHFKKKEELDTTIEMTFLTAMAGVTILVDFFIDIWFYAPLGRSGNLYLHLSIVGVYALYCLWRKLHLKYILPAFIEVAYVFTITLVTGDSYVPHLTAFMGLTITWLIMLWVSGFKHRQSKSKLGKLISNIV